MIKNRYILRLKGSVSQDLNKESLMKILASYNLKIIDDSMFPKMILVEGDEKISDSIPVNIKDIWNIFEEKGYTVPDTRKYIKGKK
jgi:hypothetical protein